MGSIPTRLTRSELLEGAESALRRCEVEVQELLARAAGSGLYDEINRMTEIARSLDDMATAAQSAQRLEPGSDRSFLSVASKPVGTATRRGPRAKEYPKFFRDGEHLVKIGWSKKNREEYVHRAKFEQVSSIVEYLVVADNGRPMPVDNILAVRESDGAEIPGYQIYLVLAWLRKEGVIDRVGRNGYVVKDFSNLKEIVSNLRSALPEFRVA